MNFRVYAEKWVEERELAVRTEDLYKHLLRLYTFHWHALDKGIAHTYIKPAPRA